MATASAPQRKGLGDVAAVADAAGVDQRNLAGLVDVVERLARLADRGDAGHAGLLGGQVRAGAGAALHAVHVDAVGVGLGRHAHVVVDPRRAQLELDRDLAVGRLADFLDLEREVVGAEPVRVARRGALIDAGGQRAHLGDLVGDLLAHQVAAEADLAALADEELTGIGEPQMVRVEAVTRLDTLVQPFGGITPLVRDHAALARAGRGAGHGGAAGERDLGLVAERAKAHAGHVDRDIELQRPLGLGPDHGLGLALLPIALDHEAGEGAGQKGQIVPGRDFLEQREAAHAVAAELGLDVDVVDHLGREHEALAQAVGVALGIAAFRLRLSLRLRAFGGHDGITFFGISRAPASFRWARGCRSSRVSCRTRSWSCSRRRWAPPGHRSRACVRASGHRGR